MTRSRLRKGFVGALALLMPTQYGSAGGHSVDQLHAAACTVTASPPRRIALSDGTTLTIDVSSVARNRGDVLIAGTPTYLWPRGSARGSSPVNAGEAFGVVRDARGRFALVPPPPGVRDAKHPHVVSAGEDGWHAVFVTGSLGTPRNALAFPEAEIWYGRYDGRRWRGVVRIARAYGAELLPGRSSGLVIARTGLAFAYAFDQSAVRRSNAAGNQGLVLLHRRGSDWKADTLPTWESPGTIQLATDTLGALVAIYTHAYFEGGRSHGPDLFTARYATQWDRPRVALKIPSRHVAAPMVAGPVHTGSVIAWQSSEPGTLSAILEWGMFGSDHLVRPMGHLAPTSNGERPAMVKVDGANALWIVRDGQSSTSLRLIAAQGDTARDLGAIRVPADNPVMHAAVLTNGTVLIISGGLGRASSDPPASSYLTTAVVRCTGARRLGGATRVPSTQ